MAAKDKNIVFPNWHPDFRIQATLPDVKVVRTGFLVNFVAITLPLLLAGLILVDWMDARSLEQQIENQKQAIQGESAGNSMNVKKSKEFDVASSKLNDVDKFLTRSLNELDVVIAIADSRPKAVALSDISYSEREQKVGKKMVTIPRITLKGVLQGVSADEVSMLDEYKATLEKLPVFEGMLDNVSLPEPTQDENLGLSKFNITIELKPAKQK